MGFFGTINNVMTAPEGSVRSVAHTNCWGRFRGWLWSLSVGLHWLPMSVVHHHTSWSGSPGPGPGHLGHSIVVTWSADTWGTWCWSGSLWPGQCGVTWPSWPAWQCARLRLVRLYHWRLCIVSCEASSLEIIISSLALCSPSWSAWSVTWVLRILCISSCHAHCWYHLVIGH